MMAGRPRSKSPNITGWFPLLEVAKRVVPIEQSLKFHDRQEKVTVESLIFRHEECSRVIKYSEPQEGEPLKPSP